MSDKPAHLVDRQEMFPHVHDTFDSPKKTFFLAYRILLTWQ